MERQDLKTPALVHGIKCLLQVNEDTKERHLLQMRQLLSQLGFDDPCFHASSSEASMEAVV